MALFGWRAAAAVRGKASGGWSETCRAKLSCQSTQTGGMGCPCLPPPPLRASRRWRSCLLAASAELACISLRPTFSHEPAHKPPALFGPVCRPAAGPTPPAAHASPQPSQAMAEQSEWTPEDVRFMRSALQEVRRAGARRRQRRAGGGQRRQSQQLEVPSLVSSAPCCLCVQACRALEEGETPVGCVVVRDGAVIAAGCNRTNATRNVRRPAACPVQQSGAGLGWAL